MVLNVGLDLLGRQVLVRGPDLAIGNSGQDLVMTLQGIPDPQTSLFVDLAMPGKSLNPPCIDV